MNFPLNLATLQATSVHADGLKGILPELVLVFFSLVVLVIDLVKRGPQASRIMGWVTMAGLAIAGWVLIEAHGTPARDVYGLVRVDNFGGFFKLFTVASMLVVCFYLKNDRMQVQDSLGEYYFLLLGAGIGIFFMVGTNNLLMLMLGLELLSLASYALAGYHKSKKSSAEAAMKYVVFGGLSAGIMIYGMSLLYGLTGTLDLAQMSSGIATAGDDGVVRSLGVAIQNSPAAVAVAVMMILAGFAFKISVAPFHFWAPDVYEGAPTPVTTFLAVASKAAGFGALLRFLGVLFANADPLDVEPVVAAVGQYGAKVGTLLAVLAALTMTLGNLAAVKQESIKRMLAYSSVAHAGYILMGVVVMNEEGFYASMFYMAAYYFMNLGAFGVLLYFQGITGKDTYESIKGIGYKAPIACCAMVVFLVSLTGIPPTIGFTGKLLLFKACINNPDFVWLAVVAGVNSAISLYYYMRVVRSMFLSGEAEVTPAPRPVFVGFLVLLAVLTVGFFLVPGPLSEWAKASLDILTASR